MNETQGQTAITATTGTIAAPITESVTVSTTAALGAELPPVSIAADVHPIESALAASTTPPGLSTRIDALESTIADIQARLEHHGIVGR